MLTVSQITTCKGRGVDVLARMAAWLDGPLRELIVVDFGCPDEVTTMLRDAGYLSDARVRVVQVPQQLSGPFYDHGLARNLGARVASSEYMLFLDADTTARSLVFDHLNYEPDDEGVPVREPASVYTTIDRIPAKMKFNGVPGSWTIDGQVLIRNNVFHQLNGFWELPPVGWGAETYDLVMRASILGYAIARLPSNAFVHTTNTLESRARFMARPPASSDRLSRLFTQAAGYYAERYSRAVRAQPGRRFGTIAGDESVIVWSKGTYRRLPSYDE